MARKSRTAAPIAAVALEKVYNTAIYARLSSEEIQDQTVSSLDNQIYLVRQYIEERPYLKLCSVFSDNGETGTNFDRPQFNKMMDEVRAGNINCIAVKDLSRFGRNYIETGEYLEKIFPFMGVRFIAINDGLDNEDKDSNTDALIVSLKNLINDVYAKDISQKIASSYRIRQQNGEYIGGLPLYGYKKSEENHHRLVIDEETAPLIRDIFKWKGDGMGDTAIARRLNEMGVPSPTKRLVDMGLIKKTNYCKLFIWRDRTIRLITTNPMYIGHMTQGRRRQALYENMPQKVLPQSEWVIVENTHEPIVDKIVFDMAQEARAKNTKDFYKNYDKSKHLNNEGHVFKGLLVCADCGSKLSRIKTKIPNLYNFYCPVEKKNLGTECTRKYVNEAALYDIVLVSIKKEIQKAADLSAIVERLNKHQSVVDAENNIVKRAAQLQKELKRLTQLKASLYESYADKLLTEDEYIYSKQRYGQQIEEVRQSLERLQEENTMQAETLTPQNKWLQALKRFTDHDELSRDMVHALINRIIVSDVNKFGIVWNFKNEYEALCDYTGEVSE